MQECEKTVKTVSLVPTCANVMLAVVINSFYETPAFIMYVVPVKTLTAQFLYDVVNTILKVMHSARGHVFSIMWGNILVNEKTKCSAKHLVLLHRLCVLTKTRRLKCCSHYLIRYICFKIFGTIGVLKKFKL